MKTSAAQRRPVPHMIDREADTILDLAYSVEDRQPQVSALLIDEMNRAKVVPADRLPADVVTMGCEVEFTDASSDTRRTVRLVYPGEADIAADRISILTPVGAALIGLRAGQSILWPDREGTNEN